MFDEVLLDDDSLYVLDGFECEYEMFLDVVDVLRFFNYFFISVNLNAVYLACDIAFELFEFVF